MAFPWAHKPTFIIVIIVIVIITGVLLVLYLPWLVMTVP